MLVFKKISISGEANGIQNLISNLRLTDGWRRDTHMEEIVRSQQPQRRVVYCFSTPTLPLQGQCNVWFHTNDSQTAVELTNIVPQGLMQLSKPEYNFIVDLFYNTFLANHIDTTGIHINITSDIKTIEEAFHPDTALKLRSFSDSANKSTGSGHPSDQKRWVDFIIAAFTNHDQVSSTELMGFLTEDLEWHSDISVNLIMEYAFGLDVLKQFSEIRG